MEYSEKESNILINININIKFILTFDFFCAKILVLTKIATILPFSLLSDYFYIGSAPSRVTAVNQTQTEVFA